MKHNKSTRFFHFSGKSIFNSRPPYFRDGKCWSYTKGRKPMEMLTVRIWPKSKPNLAILSREK